MVATPVRRLAVLALVLLAAASPARAVVLWEGSGGWNFGGTNSFGGLTQPSSPPARVTSGGDFSNGGALCPPLDTPDYICGYYFGESNLVGSPGGLITLRASARLRMKNATGVGFVKLVYGGARATIVGLAFSSVAPPVSQVVFNFGLHGTRLESTTNGQVTVEGKGVAYLSADAQHFVQCFADVCEPIKVNVSSAWDPGAPNGTVFLIDLRADARITAPLGAQFDAEAVADYKDTLELLSLEPKDANGDTVPGVSLVINDNQGQPIYTFPNTPPAVTTTTTLPGGAVTTTTLPAECAVAATFSSVTCRLAKLLEAVQATADGPVEVKLLGKVGSAQEAVTAAEQLRATSPNRSSKQIRKALNALAAYKKVLKTRVAKRALGTAARSALAAPLATLRADLKALGAKP